MSSADANATLAQMVAQLNALPGHFERESLPAIGKAILAAVQATASAGTTPEGVAWAPKQAGGQALASAPGKITLTTATGKISLALAGPIALHHKGWVRGGTRRQVLPVGNMPAAIEAAAKKAADSEIKRLLRGR